MVKVKTVGSRYYGGDNFDQDDEESTKLLLKDCHQKQSELYSITLLPNSAAQFILSPLSKGELLFASGQSRLYLYHRENDDKKIQYQSKPSENLDFLIFRKSLPNPVKFPNFPLSLDEEASLFRSHGLPLLVWPKNRDKPTVQKYLDEFYPDCGIWFRELDKSMNWLEEKWKPIVSILGIDVSAECGIPHTSPTLLGLSDNCIAMNFIKTRTAWYINYANLLQSYLVQRRMASPGFQHNPIHFRLASLHLERQSSLNNDSGFFKIAGNRILQLGLVAQSEGRKLELKIREMSECIQDSQKKAQFLSVLLPVSDLKEALSGKIRTKKRAATKSSQFTPEKFALMEALDAHDDSAGEDVEEMHDGSSNENSDASNEVENDKNEAKLPSLSFPNRPVTKEIMKNKGIVKYRHKRERNPRVHLRHKFKKAQIRYRSRVPNVRKEDTPYAGELRGIRVNLIKSHRFKKST